MTKKTTYFIINNIFTEYINTYKILEVDKFPKDIINKLLNNSDLIYRPMVFDENGLKYLKKDCIIVSTDTIKEKCPYTDEIILETDDCIIVNRLFENYDKDNYDDCIIL